MSEQYGEFEEGDILGDYQMRGGHWVALPLPPPMPQVQPEDPYWQSFRRRWPRVYAFMVPFLILVMWPRERHLEEQTGHALPWWGTVIWTVILAAVEALLLTTVVVALAAAFPIRRR